MRKSRVILIVTIPIVTILICTYLLTNNDRFTNLFNYSKAAISYYGSRGQEVRTIQTRLKNWGYYDGSIDGVYGYRTYQAIRKFQAKNGLKVDGVAGSQTLAALGIPPRTAASRGATSTSRSKDERLLAHIIHGEARGEPYLGQVAVGAVILNRTRDSRFPKTIAGVVYQPGAFDAVEDGQINLAPNDTSFRAARDALNGWDPTYGCVFYYNPATATSRWIWGKQIVLKIGKHNFAK